MENNRKSLQADIERYDLEILLRKPSLRASVSRRVSQIRRGTITTPDTTCGMGCIRGQWLQTFANRTSFIFIYEVLGSFYASYIAYFYGTITTLEKRFKLSSQSIGIIAGSGYISKIVVCFFLLLFPPNVHKPRCIGLGVFIVIISALIFTMPYFLYGSGPESSLWHSNTTKLQDVTLKGEVYSLTIFRNNYLGHLLNILFFVICNLFMNFVGNCTESCLGCNKHTNENTFPIFLLTQILHGIGGGLYQTLGKSYKDDNIHLRQSPPLISLLSILRTLGPAFGFWLSSVCLKTHIDKDFQSNETHWIGAWWLGNLMIAFILFVVSLLLILFPPTLPKAAVRRIFNNTKGQEEAEQNSTRGKTKIIQSSFIGKAFNSIRFSEIFNVVGFPPYFIFLPKYVEIQYRISASIANLTAGTITLISAAFGIVMASSVITRYQPKARVLASWTVIIGVLSTGGLISYTYLKCTESDLQNKAAISQYSRLNNCKECGFQPICTESEITECVTPFDEISHDNATKVYKNCSEVFLKDLCTVDCYSDFLLFIIVNCSIAFAYATGQTANFWLEIKYPDKKPPLGYHFINILASIPAPIIFGFILDKNCLLWDNHCIGTGNCWQYDNENLRHIINFTSIAFGIIGIILNLSVWYSIKNITLFPDEDNDEDDDCIG